MNKRRWCSTALGHGPRSALLVVRLQPLGHVLPLRLCFARDVYLQHTASCRRISVGWPTCSNMSAAQNMLPLSVSGVHSETWRRYKSTWICWHAHMFGCQVHVRVRLSACLSASIRLCVCYVHACCHRCVSSGSAPANYGSVMVEYRHSIKTCPRKITTIMGALPLLRGGTFP